MPARATTRKKASVKVPDGPPCRVEIRLDGRVRFADVVWGVQLEKDVEAGVVTLLAALKPTMVEPPELLPQAQGSFGDDIRDGEVVIQQVHSGRRAR